MLRQIRVHLIALAAASLAIGCADSVPEAPASVDVPADTASAEATPPSAAGMEPVNFEKWEALRMDMVPDVVVVDLWASWCVPCLEKFPAMVAMNEKYADRGVRFVSLSLDDRDSPADLEFANEFLSKQGPSFPHYLLDETLMDGFQKVGIRGVPAVDIYGRDGELAVRLTGDDPNNPFDESDVEAAVVQLLETPVL